MMRRSLMQRKFQGKHPAGATSLAGSRNRREVNRSKEGTVVKREVSRGRSTEALLLCF